MNRRDALAMLAATGTLAAAPVFAQQSQPAATAVQPKIARKGRIKQGLWRVNFGPETKLTFDDQCREAARLHGDRAHSAVNAARPPSRLCRPWPPE